MTEEEKELREICRTLGGENTGDDTDAECQFRDALMAMLDEERLGEMGDNPDAIRRHCARQVSAALAAMKGTGE